jgi:hypothetical protein
MENNKMRELNKSEIKEVNGGFWNFVLAAIADEPNHNEHYKGKSALDTYLYNQHIPTRSFAVRLPF